MKKTEIRITRSTIFPLIEQWTKQGGSLASFAEQQNINQHTFRYWYKKYQMENNKELTTTEKFVPLTMSWSESHTAPIEIHYPNGTRILLKGITNLADLKTLVQ